MSLATEVEEYIRAGFVGIWVRTHEQDDAVQELLDMCNDHDQKDNEEGGNDKRQRGWTLCSWDLQNKLVAPLPAIKESALMKDPSREGYAKPGILFRDIPDLAKVGKKRITLFVMHNFHMKDLIDNPLYIQSIQNLISTGKGEADHRYYLIFMAPVAKLPSDLEKFLVVAEHKLPDKATLWNIASEIASGADCAIPEDAESKMLVQEAAAGLTRYEAEGAFALSLIRTRDKDKRIDPKIVWSVKSQSLKKRGLLEIYEGDASFDKMGGLDYYRSFCGNLLKKRTTDPMLFPRGLLLLGVPGSGKSDSVKCLGNETGRPVLRMRMGALRSKFQGESDANLEASLEIADVMAPCVLYVDEVEKALSGVGSGGATDGGTGDRMFGRLLEWQQEHRSDVFFVCTCNDISRIMESNPEFARAERFDGMFFFDVPTAKEREVIWDIYLDMFKCGKTNKEQLVDQSDAWTGAEIRSCCRLSRITGETLMETAKTIVPIALTADSTLTSLRRWAAGKCRSVNEAGLFRYTEKGETNRVVVKKKKGLRRKLSL